MTKGKHDFRHFCKVIKKEKNVIAQWHKTLYSVLIWSSDYSLLGCEATNIAHLNLGILCHFSLQILSSSVRLNGERWVMFDQVHVRALAGLLKDIHRLVPKPLLFWSSDRITIRFLVTSLIKALLPRLLSLGRWPALGRLLVVSNFFYLRMMEATVFFRTFNAADFFFLTLSYISYTCLGGLWTIPSTSWLAMQCQLWDLI